MTDSEYDRLADKLNTTETKVNAGHLHKFLNTCPDFEPLTLAELFAILEHEPALVELFSEHFLNHYIEKFRSLRSKNKLNANQPQEGSELDTNEPKMTYLALHWAGLRLRPNEEFDFKASQTAHKSKKKPSFSLSAQDKSWELDMPYLSCSGKTEVLEKDYLDKNGHVIFPAGRPVYYAVDMTPLERLLHLPILLEANEIQQASLTDDHGRYLQMNCKVSGSVSLWDYLHSIFTEISFHGDSEQKESTAQALQEQVNDLDFIEQGTEPEVMLYSGSSIFSLLGNVKEDDPLYPKKELLCQQMEDSALFVRGYEFLEKAQIDEKALDWHESRGYFYNVDLRFKEGRKNRYPLWQLTHCHKELFRRLRLQAGHLSDLQFHLFCTEPFVEPEDERLKGHSLSSFLTQLPKDAYDFTSAKGTEKFQSLKDALVSQLLKQYPND